jgi:L-fuconolactonase
VQADQSETETSFLLQCAKDYPIIKGVVGWVDLRAEDAGERLAHYAQDKLFKGVRHIVQAEADDFMLRDDFQNGIAQLAPLGLTYDILIYPRQLDAALALVKKFPEQRFVLDHLAKPAIGGGVDEKWRRKIFEMGEYPNVYCKVSGMVTETKGYKWDRDDFEGVLSCVLQAFGSQRLMFGSDWPVCLLAAEYKEVLDLVVDYFKREDPEGLPGIMGTNAAKFYNVEEGTRS